MLGRQGQRQGPAEIFLRALLSGQAKTVLGSLVGLGQLIATHGQDILFAGDLQHLVDEVRIGLHFIQRLLEQLELHVQIHAIRGTVEADEPGVNLHAGVLALGAWMIGRTAKIHRIAGDESSIPLEYEGLQLPILQSCPTQPDHVGRLIMSPVVGACDEFRTEALVDQELHPAGLRRGTRRSATLRAPSGSASRVRGRPRAGLASA